MTESPALWLARVTLNDPYPPDIFTPLDANEMVLIQGALRTCRVRNASDRLHASWARHLYWVAQQIEKEQTT